MNKTFRMLLALIFVPVLSLACLGPTELLATPTPAVTMTPEPSVTPRPTLTPTITPTPTPFVNPCTDPRNRAYFNNEYLIFQDFGSARADLTKYFQSGGFDSAKFDVDSSMAHVSLERMKRLKPTTYLEKYHQLEIKLFQDYATTFESLSLSDNGKAHAYFEETEMDIKALNRELSHLADSCPNFFGNNINNG